MRKEVFSLTRNYFLDYVTDWSELIELCQDYNCDICEDIIDDDTLDEYVDSDISNRDCGWRSLRDYLSDIPTGYDYYRYDGSFDYVGLDDGDFEDYKSRVLDWMDEDDLWDAEEGEEDEDEEGFDPDYDFFSPGEPEEPEEPPVEEEDFSVSVLMSMCGSELITIRQATERHKKELDDNMVALFAV